MGPPDPEYIFLESRNSRDISQAELEELAQSIRADLAELGRNDVVVVPVAHEAVGVGSHWIDVLNLFLPSQEFVRDAIWTKVLEHTGVFMRGRFGRKHEEHRPRVIIVRESENGEILSVRELKDPDGELRELDDLGRLGSAMKPRRPPSPPD